MSKNDGKKPKRLSRVARQYKQFRETNRSDPLMRELVRELQASGKTKAFIAERSGVSLTTLRAWERGAMGMDKGTRRPQSATMSFAARALGKKLVWTDGD